MIQTVINNMGPGVVVERFTLTYADCTTAGASQTFTLKAVPKGSLLLGARVLCNTAFSGGATNACTLSLGSAGAAVDTFLTASTIFTGVTGGTTFYVTSTKGVNAGIYAADSWTATIASGNGNVNTLTAGSVSVDLVYILFEDLTATAPVGNTPASGGLL